MKEQIREEPKILAAAERQMRTWAWSHEHENAQGTALAERPSLSTSRKVSYIAISREAGAGGGEIAAMVGRKLGWEVLDKNLLDQIADRFRLSKPMLELVNETDSNWAYDVVGAFLDPKIIPHEKYLAHLSRVVRAAARRGNVVLVGRGRRFILPRENGLAVRIVASMKYRVARIVQQLNCDEAKARQYVHVVDHGRKELVEKFFHRDVTDPGLYDLVLYGRPSRSSRGRRPDRRGGAPVEKGRVGRARRAPPQEFGFIRLKRAQPTIATQDCATEGVPVPLLCSAISGRSNRRFDAGRTGLRGGWLEQRGGTGTCPPFDFPPSQVRFRRMNQNSPENCL